SAVTYVAIGVVSAIVIKKRFNYRATLRVGMPFWTLCVLFMALRVTQRFCDVSRVCLWLKAPFAPRRVTLMGPK
ncbi:hypothetical protein, partial [Pseudomonas cannabina]|uniref:hypothetical protein n=1 Tax=Pseudomonas cannabina TaxID=86840 RepID=UPI0029D41CBD